MNHKLGIETSTTPAESPFANGVVERNNAVLYESMMKTMEDCKCDKDLALAWAVSAKNALQNQGGYSPNQLVFGMNVNLPSVVTDLPPALEPSTSSEVVRRNLKALHSARKNFMEAEASEKIRRALNHNIRTYSEEVYEKGEKVFYRRKNHKGWRGPGVVMAQDGNFVVVRHGKSFYRVHPCHLMKVTRNKIFSNKRSSSSKENQSVVSKSNPKCSSKMKSTKEEEAYDSSDDEDEAGDSNRELVGSEAEENERGENESDPVDDAVSVTNETTDVTNSPVPEVTVEVSQVPILDQSIEIDAAEIQPENIDKQRDEMYDSSTKPRPNETIRFELSDGSVCQARVLSKQPKKKGVNKNFVNLKMVDQTDPCSVDWSNVQWWRLIEEEQQIFLNAVESRHQSVMDAKVKEYERFQSHNVFKVVEYSGQTLISCRWIITEKESNGGKVLKARLVARGFEEVLTERTDSPTCSKQSLRLLFTVASTQSWDIHSFDVTAAFLQGDEMKRDVFVLPPEEFREEGKVWKLIRTMYGLNDAPREWYNRVEHELTLRHGKRSSFDNALFIWHNEQGELIGILALHVDDFSYCGTHHWHSTVIQPIITDVFKISSCEMNSFLYIGLHVVQTSRTIYIDQEAYIKSLNPVELTTLQVENTDRVLTSEEKKILRSMSGKLLWVTSQTRPDVAFDSCVISNYGKTPTVKNLFDVNKAIKKLQSTELKLSFPNLGEKNLIEVKVYGDATHASLPSGASQGAFIAFLCGNNYVAPITWKSKKLDRVTKSPLASETMALAEAADNGFLIAKMTQEVFGLNVLPKVTCFTDNKSLYDNLQSSKIVQDSRLRVDIARIREMVHLGEINVVWVDKTKQLADPLTKAGASCTRLLQVLRTGAISG